MRDGRSGIIAALVAAAVSLLIGAGTVAVSWWTQNQQHERAISDLKLKILSRVATDERSVANAALVHVLRPLDTEERYSSFVESYLELASQLGPASDTDAEEPDAVALPNQEAIATKSTTDLVAKFPTADRLSASNELIERYADSPEAVVAAVIGGIVSEFDPNSYRINLYVAYTLARIRPGWRGTDQQFLELCELKKHAYYRDSTLYKRVNHAIAAFIHGDEERERRLIRACS